ncbi:MAG: Bug family tripartite tricarboxylate transporter substrate binding protein [Betaproteobacteria bacterium]
MGFKLGLIALALAFAQSASAQTGPVRLVVGFPPGGSADTTARLLADKMKDTLGVPVLVENKPGAGGRIAAQMVKDAPPDGNVVMVVPFAVMVVQPMVFKSIKYDTTKDFTAVGNAATFPLALAAGPATPANNMKELIAWFHANPGKANFGSPAAGSMPHFMGEMLADAAKMKLTHVAYQGGAPLVSNLLGGQIPIGFDTPAEFAEYHKTGKLRILALSGAQRNPTFPDVPTFKEQGIDIDALAWFGVFGPPNMPKATVDKLNASLQAALKSPDLAQRLASLGLTAAPGSADAMAQQLAADKKAWATPIKNSGFQAD